MNGSSVNTSYPICSFQNIVVDLGDVIFTWSPAKDLRVSPKILREILRSSVWFDYEKGKLSQEDCYSLVAAAFGLESQDVKAAIDAAYESLQEDRRMTDLLIDLKRFNHYRVYAMSNISTPDYKVLRCKAGQETWDLFDDIFTSAAAGERKPNLGYFRHVVSSAGLDPHRTIFVDDKVENILTARSIGMHGIFFDDFMKVSQRLRTLSFDPVAKALEYLNMHQKNLVSTTSTHQLLQENFAQLLIFEATGERRLVDFKLPSSPSRRFNFFKGDGQFTTKKFPDDVDTTAIGYTVVPDIDPQTKADVMDEIVTLLNPDGIVQVYFDPRRPRIDPVVCVNVLTLFYANDRGSDLKLTLEWCYDVLIHRAYIDGTLYYASPEAFLFFLSRLLATSRQVRSRFAVVFGERVTERIGVEGDALELSMRILAGAVVGIRDVLDYQKLRSMQEPDGSWPAGWLYKYGASGVMIGNKGLTTALALKAIQVIEEVDRHGEAMR